MEDIHLSYADRKVVEHQVLAAEELLRRQEGDSLRNFELFHPQRAFVDAVLDRTNKENYYVGANRSGKSDAGAYTGSHLARFGYRHSKREQDIRKVGSSSGSGITVRDFATSGWVSAIDFPTGRDTIQPKYFDNGFCPPGATHNPFIPDREISEWRVSDQILKLKNGSIIGFKSADSGRKKYQGAEKDWVHLDEEHPEAIYDEILIRVGANPLQVFTTCTLLPPEGQVGGVTWIYSKIIKRWKQGTLENCGIFNASIYNNPHIPREEIAFLESKYPEGSDQNRIRLKGELIGGLGGSRIYASFNPLLNTVDLGEIQKNRPLAWIWDFNVEPMVSLIGQRHQKIFRVYRELILEEGNIQEMCDYFRRVHPYHKAEIYVYGDASGNNRSHQTKRSSYNIIMNAMADYPVPLRLKVPEKNPSIADRVNSVNVACKGIQGEINLSVDRNCDETIDDLEQVVSDGKQGIKKTFNKKDPYYRRTHMTDALGYWIFAEAPIVPIKSEALRKTVRIPTAGYVRNR